MQITLDHKEILNLEERKRRNFINSLSGFKSLHLIGTTDKNGQTNLAIFNSVFHIGANPPLMGFLIRPDSVERHTLENIMETKCYTLNHVNTTNYRQAHQTAARYPKSISEFDATGLKPEYRNNFQAPYVSESHVKIGLELQQRVNIELNGTVLMIGLIREVHFPSDCWSEDGLLLIEKAGTITGSGLDTYHQTQLLDRLSYAKPDKQPESIIT